MEWLLKFSTFSNNIGYLIFQTDGKCGKKMRKSYNIGLLSTVKRGRAGRVHQETLRRANKEDTPHQSTSTDLPTHSHAQHM